MVILSDIDDCADQPCQNGGNCTDAVNGYTCNCVSGYSGKNCSIGEDEIHFESLYMLYNYTLFFFCITLACNCCI